MTAIGGQSSSDSWDQPLPVSISHIQVSIHLIENLQNYSRPNNAFRRQITTKSIPDDWDADDDESEEDNQKIWEDA